MDARSERVARRFEPWMVAAALLVIPVLVIEQSELPDPWSTVGAITNWIIWLAFLAETVTMLTIVPNRRAWLRAHPLDVAVVVLTPPFLPALLQGFRAARLVRLVRILRLGRALSGLRRLFTLEGLRWAAVVGVVVILGGGAAFVSVETQQDLTTWDGFWWAFTTAATVGYGDVTPHTDAGRVIAIGVMSTGIGLIALFTGAIADRFVRTDIDVAVAEVTAEDDVILDEITEIQARLARIEELVRQRREAS